MGVITTTASSGRAALKPPCTVDCQHEPLRPLSTEFVGMARVALPCLLKQPALPFNAALNRLLQYAVAGAEQGEGFPGSGHGGIDQFPGEYRGESVRHDQGGMHELRALRLVYRHRIHGLDLLQSAG